MTQKLVFNYDINQISFTPIQQGSISNSTFRNAAGPINFLSNNCYKADTSFSVNQYNNTLNVNYIFSVYKNSTNIGTLEFSITANQPIDPINPLIFTLNYYNSKVTGSSGIFQDYQNANLTITVNGNIRTITIYKSCVGLYHDVLCQR